MLVFLSRSRDGQGEKLKTQFCDISAYAHLQGGTRLEVVRAGPWRESKWVCAREPQPCILQHSPAGIKEPALHGRGKAPTFMGTSQVQGSEVTSDPGSHGGCKGSGPHRLFLWEVPRAERWESGFWGPQERRGAEWLDASEEGGASRGLSEIWSQESLVLHPEEPSSVTLAKAFDLTEVHAPNV